MKKKFGRFEAELCELPDGREGVDCFVHCGAYSSSLAVAMAFGLIDDEIPIGNNTVRAIEDWAEKHGY